MPAEQDSKVIQSVDLTMRILECLARGGGEKGVSEIARELSATKARIFRHLQTLRQLGYVSHNKATKKDRIGMRLHLLARMVGDNVELTRAVRPTLENLRDSTGETAVFATLLDGKMTIIDFTLGTAAVQFTFRPGAAFSLYSSSLGHVSLAFGPEEYWEDIQAERFEKETPHTITDLSTLKLSVDRVREQGWAIVPEGAILGVNAIAAPVRYHDGSYAGAIAIVGSVQNIPADPSAKIIAHVIAAGEEASRNLGWKPGDQGED